MLLAAYVTLREMGDIMLNKDKNSGGYEKNRCHISTLERRRLEGVLKYVMTVAIDVKRKNAVTKEEET